MPAASQVQFDVRTVHASQRDDHLFEPPVGANRLRKPMQPKALVWIRGPKCGRTVPKGEDIENARWGVDVAQLTVRVRYER